MCIRPIQMNYSVVYGKQYRVDHDISDVITAVRCTVPGSCDYNAVCTPVPAEEVAGRIKVPSNVLGRRSS